MHDVYVYVNVDVYLFVCFCLFSGYVVFDVNICSSHLLIISTHISVNTGFDMCYEARNFRSIPFQIFLIPFHAFLPIIYFVSLSICAIQLSLIAFIMRMNTS